MRKGFAFDARRYPRNAARSSPRGARPRGGASPDTPPIRHGRSRAVPGPGFDARAARPTAPLRLSEAHWVANAGRIDFSTAPSPSVFFFGVTKRVVFFSQMNAHSSKRPSDRARSFSFFCLPPPTFTKSLRVAPSLQIRRSSYHDVVRVRDVCRLFDARNIQTYVINGARVVFLNERPHPRGKLSAGVSGSGGDKKTTARDAAGARRSSCRKCSRTLQSDTGWYCSIACKAAVAGKDLSLIHI